MMQTKEINAQWWLAPDLVSFQKIEMPFEKDPVLYLVHGLPGFSDDLEKVYQKAYLSDFTSCISILGYWERQHKQIARSLGMDMDLLISQHFYHLNRYAHLVDHLSVHTWMAQSEILSSRIFFEMLYSIENQSRWISLPSLVIGEEDHLQDDIVHLNLRESAIKQGNIWISQRSLCRMPDGSVGYFPDKVLNLFRKHTIQGEIPNSQAA